MLMIRCTHRINDCAVWPLINFVGFAYVPTILQPTYMSCVQFFWQTYVSSVACSNKLAAEEEAAGRAQKVADVQANVPPGGTVDIHGVLVHASDTQKLTELLQLNDIFEALDIDHSGYLDAHELKTALNNQGVEIPL
jgi:hypothetical protein